MQKRILSIVLCVVMLCALLPYSVMAETDERTLRTVYLHAQGENPKETVHNSIVYLGEDADIYFAVDNPNKGEYLPEDDPDVLEVKEKKQKEKEEEVADRTDLTEDEKEAYIKREVAKAVEAARHKDPQFDMNGYTIRIAYDPVYFELASDNINSPIEYEIPDFNFETTDKDKEDIGEDSDDEVPQSVGYFVFKHGSQSAYQRAGITYKTAYITVFYSGGFVPQKKSDQLWYNLAKLSLTPKKQGPTDVFVDVDSGDENYMVELFAKDKSGNLSEQTFDFSAENGGFHHILIKDRTRPESPVLDPPAGSYVESVDVAIKHSDPNCIIYYTTDGSDPLLETSTRQIYNPEKPIHLTTTSVIKTCAYRPSDGKYSYVISGNYEILPDRPYLFADNSGTKILIGDVYSEASKFNVYVSDKDDYGPIADDSIVYYTFSDADAENPVIGSDPEKAWVEVAKANPSIEIDRKRTVRLITKKLDNYSNPATYFLSVKVSPALANVESGLYHENKLDVELTSATEGATIYYTTDGTDPKTSESRRIYDGTPITIAQDLTLRAVAYYDGEWSDKTSYYYLFSKTDDYGIGAFYPPGVYEGSVLVTLTPNTPDYKIKYHFGDGEWKDYTGTFPPIDKNTEIFAKTQEVDEHGNVISESPTVYNFSYKIKPLPPEFAPQSTQFSNADQITIYTPESTSENTERFVLYYTLDGSDPIENVAGRIQADPDSDAAIINISEYTVVSAVVLKDGVSYSTVVTHSYDVVVAKPVKPLTTLLPGDYVIEIGGEGYTTQFTPVPKGTEVYYTISYGGALCPDPVPHGPGTFLYDGVSEIAVDGKTTIKAVAVDEHGVKSDIGIFVYNVSVEAPIAAPSSIINATRLPLIPVDAVKGSKVIYEIGDFATGETFTNEFYNTDDERFYIDTHTGEAFRDALGTERLGNTSTITNGDSATLKIYAVYHEVSSDTNEYVYSLTDDETYLMPPYADKATGTYKEIAIDNSDNILAVRLYSLNTGGTIQYRFGNDKDWDDYTLGESLMLKGDTIMQLRYKKVVNGTEIYSKVVSYVYNFVPLPPIIELPSGTYMETDNVSTKIAYDERAPKNKVANDYYIWYRSNGNTEDYIYRNAIPIPHTMSFKAYVRNEKTGRVSTNTVHYYIIDKDTSSLGSVYIKWPFDQKRISAHELGKGHYASGIQLDSKNKAATIVYSYFYTNKSDGQSVPVDEADFNFKTPIMPTELMDDITIIAYLKDKDGNKIDGSDSMFYIDFIHLGIPSTSLEESGEIQFPHGTNYTFVADEHTDDPTVILYYTIDGTDPKDSGGTRQEYNEETLKTLKDQTTINAVYYSGCGECESCINHDIRHCDHPVYGEVGTFTYTAPKQNNSAIIVTGGGGGTTIDNTRKYTKDIFGTEHPTHIGYINGYPDGSVRPDGQITREEVTAVLYRIRNHTYEEPFSFTGDVFPDVNRDRWSVKDIEYMAQKEVVLGYPDGEFKPSRNLTRAEFVALIYRFTGLEEKEIENPFDDVKDTHWAYKEILALAENGLVEGYEDGTFKPENNITRAEVMTVINKILGRKPLESYVKSLKFNPYNDLYEDKWYYVTVLEATITHNYWLNDAGYEVKWEDWK